MEINFFPIQFEFDTFQINTEQYTIERLAALRQSHNSTHSFFRTGDRIYISNKDGDENLQLGELTEVKLFDESDVTASLIKHVFFRSFKDRFPNYIPIDFYPFRFFSGQEKDDIIYSALPTHLQNKIAYKKLIEVQERLILVDNKPQFGFIINIRRNWIFTKNCAELHSEGFNLIGLDILKLDVLPGLQGVLGPDEEFIGVVKEIRGSNAAVHTNDGLLEFPLSKLTLRKTKYNIGAYLSFALSEQRSAEILQIIEGKRHEIYNATSLYREIKNIATTLFTVKGESGKSAPYLFQNKDGFCFTVDTQMKRAANSMELKAPTFIFDYSGTKTDGRTPDAGLTNFGPYDSITFEPKSPNILCICHKANRGAFTTFLAKLKDGIPTSNYFKKGLQKKYDLQEIQFTVCELATFDNSEYLRIIKENDNVRPDLAIIEIPNEFRQLDDASNPYYKIKAKLLLQEVPVQFITTAIVRGHNEYHLNSIALQIYAKLGGTPWVLPSARSVDREVIIGIGHSWIRENAFSGASQDRVVGITTFMSSDGQYLLADKAKDVAYDEYFNELLRSLKNSFAILEKEQGWNDGDTVRLIFHIFKPIKNIEFEVVSALIQQFTRFKIQFAFVTVSKTHPFKLFESSQQGISSRYGNAHPKGAFIPDRATNVFLDSNSALVQMFGARELKTEKHGMSNPILVRIRVPQGNFENQEVDRLLFADISYIVQQLFSFTYLSWRSFLPGEQPATMLYSTLISKLLSKLRKVNGWDSDSLNFKLKRKKWFL
jgi:hypothetical protein